MKRLTYLEKIKHLKTKYNVDVSSFGGVKLTDYNGVVKLYSHIDDAHRAAFGY